MSEIKTKNQLKEIQKRIDAACQSVDRKPENITLMLATKRVSTENINHALDAGEKLLGEKNRIIIYQNI